MTSSGTPAASQRLHEPMARRGRLLGWLEDDRVAGGQPGRHQSGGNREREVPRADRRDHPARAVAQLVSLAGQLKQGLPSARESA